MVEGTTLGKGLAASIVSENRHQKVGISYPQMGVFPH